MKHLSIFLLFALILLNGCWNRTDLNHVSGVIQYGNAPLAGASVAFLPFENGGVLATGTTDENGRFVLSAPIKTGGVGQGAMSGKYHVIVSKTESSVDPDQAAYKRGEISYDELHLRLSKKGGSKSSSKSLIPEKYSSKEHSGLEAIVEPGKANDFSFTLEGR